jgi:hypothetical protein
MVDDNCGYLFADNNQLGVDITTAQFFKTWITQPLTMVYRVASFDLDVALQYTYYRDMHQIYHLLQAGKGYLFAFDGGVRTRHEGGMAGKATLLEQSWSGMTIAEELFRINKTQDTKVYYQNMLQFYIYQAPTKWDKIKKSIKLFVLDHNLLSLLKNIYKH